MPARARSNALSFIRSRNSQRGLTSLWARCFRLEMSMSRGPTLNGSMAGTAEGPGPARSAAAEQTRHSGHDPNQPRVPKGRPDSGQWTAAWPDELRRVLGEVESPQSSLMPDQVLSDEATDVPVWSQYAEAAIGHNSRNSAVERTRETLEAVPNDVNGIVARATVPIRCQRDCTVSWFMPHSQEPCGTLIFQG